MFCKLLTILFDRHFYSIQSLLLFFDLLRTYYLSGTILDSRNRGEKKTAIVSAVMEQDFRRGERDNKQTKIHKIITDNYCEDN